MRVTEREIERRPRACEYKGALRKNRYEGPIVSMKLSPFYARLSDVGLCVFFISRFLHFVASSKV